MPPILSDSEPSGLIVTAGHVTAIICSIIAAAGAACGLLVRLTTRFVKMEAAVERLESERGELRTTLAEIHNTLVELRTAMAVLTTREEQRGGALKRNVT